MRTRVTTVGDIPMRWEEVGDGPAVVFLHGLPTSARLWRHVLEQLRGARGLAWELVGYGESIPAGEGRDLSLAAQAGHLVAWMRALRLGPVVLVGHDLGGGVAQRVAVAHPEWVCGLVLVSSVCDHHWPTSSVRWLRRAAPLVRRLSPEALARLLRSFYVRGHVTPGRAEEALREYLPAYLRHGGGEALVRQVRELDPHDTAELAEALTRLGVPARVLWGEDDPFQSPRHGQWLAERLGAPLERVRGGRHFVPEDRPDLVLEAVNGVLREARHLPRSRSPHRPGEGWGEGTAPP